jgi:hypothetical protein
VAFVLPCNISTSRRTTHANGMASRYDALSFTALCGTSGAALAASYHGIGATVAQQRGAPVVWSTVGRLATRSAFKVGLAGTAFALCKLVLADVLPDRRKTQTVIAGGAAFTVGGVADRAGMAATCKKFGYGRGQFVAAMFFSGSIFLGGAAALAERLWLGPATVVSGGSPGGGLEGTHSEGATGSAGAGVDGAGTGGGSFFARQGEAAKRTWTDVWHPQGHPGLNRPEGSVGHEKDKAWREDSFRAARVLEK